MGFIVVMSFLLISLLSLLVLMSESSSLIHSSNVLDVAALSLGRAKLRIDEQRRYNLKRLELLYKTLVELKNADIKYPKLLRLYRKLEYSKNHLDSKYNEILKKLEALIMFENGISFRTSENFHEVEGGGVGIYHFNLISNPEIRVGVRIGSPEGERFVEIIK